MPKKRFLFILTAFLILILSFNTAAQNIKTVAVVDFSNNTGRRIYNIESTASEYISTLLSNKSGLQVVERTKLASIMKEQGLSQSGIIDNRNTAIQLGKLLGAEYLITGSLINLNINETQFEGYGIETSKVEITLSTNIKVLNVNTGVIEAGNIYKVFETYQGESEYSLDGNGAVRSLLEKTARKFVNQLELGNKGQRDEIEKFKVEFSSKPTGASVEVDGIYMGSTPAEIPIEEGLHNITISMGGYVSWDKKVNVYDGLKVRAVLGEKESSDQE